MSVGFAIVAAIVLVLATLNAAFRRVLGYVGLAAFALLAVAAMLVVDEQYRWVGLVALLTVGGVVARQVVVHRRPKLPKDKTLPRPGAASAWAQRYQKHLAKILSTNALSLAFVDLIKHPSAEGVANFDSLLEEELRKEAEWDRKHPGFGIYLKAVGASLAENDADLQSLGAETLEELLNCPAALKRNPTRSIDRHIDFLKKVGRSEEEILFVMKEVLLPWQRDGISPSPDGCKEHTKVLPEEGIRVSIEAKFGSEIAALVEEILGRGAGSARDGGNAKNDPTSTDPMTLAGIAVMLLIYKERPFVDYKNRDVEIPSEYEDLFLESVWGYQVFTYLKLIEAKFGSEIAALVEECLQITLNRDADKPGDSLIAFVSMAREAWETHAKAPLSMPGQPDVTLPVEWRLAIKILALTPGSPFYVPLAQRANPPPKPNFNGLDITLATCLEHARAGALEVFTPLVERFALKPESVKGFKVAPESRGEGQRGGEGYASLAKAIATVDGLIGQMRAEAERLGLQPEDVVLTPEGIKPAEITWSEHPGCFERHLQRKNKNPLFPETARRITAREVTAARQRDLHEAEEFRAELRSLFDGLQTDFSGKNVVTYAQLNARRQRVENLQERANELGGDLAKERATLVKLHATMLEGMRAALAAHPEAVAMLTKAEEQQHSVEYLLLAQNVFIAQMRRADTPITTDDVIPALLAEDPATIRAVMKVLAGTDQIGVVRASASSLLTSVIDRGEFVPEANDKLRALGVEPGGAEA